jgi:N-acetylmuramoyl-L-alanine amidase
LKTQSFLGKPRNWVLAALIGTLCLLPVTHVAGSQSVYTVQPGDTLSAISLTYGVSVAILAQVNQIANPDLIITGQQISIPSAASTPSPIPDPVIAPPPASEPAPEVPGTGGGSPSYTVQSGDTLSAIASHFGVTVSALVAANTISNPDLIIVGQALLIPGASSIDIPAPVAPEPPPPASDVSRDEIRAMLYEAAAIHREDPYLMMALAWQESTWRQNVVSSAGALGVMQLMPSTAAWAGPALLGRDIDPVNNTWDNIETGVAFYAHLYSLTGSDYYALAGYYQGPYSVETQGLFPDTVRYVENVLAMRDLFASGQMP